MRILLVDDQYEEKVKAVARAVQSISDIEITHVTSMRQAIAVLKDNPVTLLIVDLQIPSELGEEVDHAGGRSLLEYILLNNDLHQPDRVLGITAHEDSLIECEEFFKARGWTIMLNPEESELAVYLKAQLRPGLEMKTFDIAILTALEHTELEAVLELPYEFEAVRFKDDITSYYTGVVQLSNGTTKSVIACSASRMGLAATASLATKVALTFKPQILAMAGIAAAVKGQAKLGDILIADPSWDWGSGKLTITKAEGVKFLSDPFQIPLNPRFSQIIKTLTVRRTYLDEIYGKFTGLKRPSHVLSAHVGPIASGAVVLEDPTTVALIKSQNRKTIGIEMEAYGLMSAAHYLGEGGPKALVVKSVCDFADPAKKNDWQPYAAFTSAQYLDKLIRNHLF